MKIEDKILYARILDPNGLTDGIQGYATDFKLVENLGILISEVGEYEAQFFVPAPNAHCAGWYYDNGKWIEINN